MTSIRFRKLDFSYPDGTRVFDRFSLEIPGASRVLFVGANGAGKSTLLRLVAGRHLLPREALEVAGRSPFYETSSSARITLIDADFPLEVDIRVSELLSHRRAEADPKREKELLELLAVDPGWHMHRVSEGQKRRVQILLALRKPVDLLLLDEVTSQLDVVVRSDFLAWLKERSRKDGLGILYATHIFDGLRNGPRDSWPTHALFLGLSAKHRFVPIAEVPSPLHRACESWIRRDLRKKRVLKSG